MKPFRRLQTAARPWAVLAMALASSAAMALPTVNLTNANYGTQASQPNGATITTNLGSVVFKRDSTQPAGTGVFNPFLRLDCKGNNCDEQGYNTSATKGGTGGYDGRQILDNMMPVNWTHDVLLSSLQLDSTNQFYQFKLDINEPGNGNSLLSLDGLKLLTAVEGQQSQYTEAVDTTTTTQPGKGDLIIGGSNGLQGNLVWDLDGAAVGGGGNVDRQVLLDATVAGGPGSGIADMVMLVSKDIIDVRKAAGDKYLILWSRFGINYGANTGSSPADAGFEEWSYSAKSGTQINPPGSSVPEPGTIALAMMALVAMGSSRKRAAKAARAA